MSTSLKDPERRFHHDQEFEFKVRSRRNRLFGAWVAQQMSLELDEADAYARELVAMVSQSSDDEELLERVLQDLQAHEQEITLHQLQKQLQYCAEDARTQLLECDNNGTSKRQ